jgi:hypothetical protein
MATDNKILWFGAGALTVILLARYYNKKKMPVKTSDLENKNPGPISISIEPNPVANNPVGSASPLTSGPITVNALGEGVKKPIYVSPRNLIPNVWDRGVGTPMYINADGGGEYTGIQKACKCSSKKQPPRTILSDFKF